MAGNLDSPKNPCAICLVEMEEPGQARAKFTAECGHTFHLNCISSSVKYGNLVCPLCKSHWTELPSTITPQQLNEICTICSTELAARGQAKFSAECGHIFHYNCITRNVRQGNRVCPTCHTQWAELPFIVGPQPTTQPTTFPLINIQAASFPRQVEQPFYPVPEPQVFNDDEPVDRQAPSSQDGPAAISSGPLEVTTHVELTAVTKSSEHQNFSVLIHVKAPTIPAAALEEDAPRAPVDIVTVLDVSGSMAGNKLALLKQAMEFVIDNLSPADRLSIISFSSGARRLIPLKRMNDGGKQLAVRAINSLTASGGTNIAEGLKKAAKTLDDRRYPNAVTSIILLSDGQDTYTMPTSVSYFTRSLSRTSSGGARNASLGRNASMNRGSNRTLSYDALIPPSVLTTPSGRAIPIHTFGFGTDHDAVAMNSIAESTGGTFSFIEDESIIQDAFAQLIGGLLTVVVQEVHINLASGDDGVLLKAVKSGSYESNINRDGSSGSIVIGDLYADEEKRFLAYVDVPVAADDVDVTKLLTVSCRYRDARTGADRNVEDKTVTVDRPADTREEQRSEEVERERVRVQATEDMAFAREAAERGDFKRAVEILDTRKKSVDESSVSQDAVVAEIGNELQEMRVRMADSNEYRRSGQAYALSSLSAHAQQRANSRSTFIAHIDRRPGASPSTDISSAPTSGGGGEGVSGRAATGTVYRTPAMLQMVNKSKTSSGSFPVLAPRRN